MNTNLYPRGGYIFTDSDGTRHAAVSWSGVIERVRLYRIRAGLPPGDAASEVIAQACTKNPGLCRDDHGQYQAALANATLKTRILTWLTRLRETAQREPLVFVGDDERKVRSQTCSTCPANQALPGGCSSCTKALTELRKTTIGNRFIDGRLNACSILGEDVPTSVHLDQIRVANGELPPYCWRKISV